MATALQMRTIPRPIAEQKRENREGIIARGASGVTGASTSGIAIAATRAEMGAAGAGTAAAASTIGAGASIGSAGIG